MRRPAQDYETATFIVRLWRETPETAPTDARWRGTAVHVQSGTQRGLRGLDDLMHFLQGWMPAGVHTPDCDP